MRDTTCLRRHTCNLPRVRQVTVKFFFSPKAALFYNSCFHVYLMVFFLVYSSILVPHRQTHDAQPQAVMYAALMSDFIAHCKKCLRASWCRFWGNLHETHFRWCDLHLLPYESDVEPSWKRLPSQWDMMTFLGFLMELKFSIFRNQTSSITINHRRGNWTTLLKSLHLRVFWLHQQYLGDEIPRGHRGIEQGKAQNMAFMSIWGSGNDISNMARHEDRGIDRNELWSFQWKWRVVGEIEEDMMDASPGKRPSSVSHPMISQWFQYKSSDGII